MRVLILLGCIWAMAPAAVPGQASAADSVRTAEVSSWRGALRDADSADGAAKFVAVMRGADADDPQALAFRAVAEVLAGTRGGGPFEKWRTFRHWTGVLDSLTTVHPAHPDIRFLRMTIKDQAPRFLFYRGGIEEDCRVVAEGLESGYWSLEAEEEFVAGVLKAVKPCQ